MATSSATWTMSPASALSFLSLFCIALGGTNNPPGSDATKALSVTLNAVTGEYQVQEGIYETADAAGYYFTNYNQSAWNYLDISMKKDVASVEEHLQYSKSLGYLEGYATCGTIKTFWPNFYSAMWGTKEPGIQTVAFVKANFEWMKGMSAQYAATDDYWYTVGATVKQVEGLYEGFVAGCPPSSSTSNTEDGSDSSSSSSSSSSIFATIDNPTLEHFLLINGWGDLYQITVKYREQGMLALFRGNRPELETDLLVKHGNNLTKAMLTYEEDEKVKRVERCSAIIKLLPDLSDIVFGHVTWDSFESLGPRIFKHYSFPLVRTSTSSSKQFVREQVYDTYFSSSPGLLSSVDDFFVISGYAKLSVIETTNSLYNIGLLDQVVPESMLSWSRAVVSNQMASSGADWALQFSRYASGTYTNQWMSLDFDMFTPGSAPKEGFLTVFEEVPGLVHYEDQTEKLVDTSYWASYNVPFYEDINTASGYATACKINSDNCYNTCPRSLIFEEYHTEITDMAGVQWMLGYNGYQNDTASQGDACNAISCRGDLNGEHSGAFGALDVKASSVTRALKGAGAEDDAPIINARLGPTQDQQPIFCWSKYKNEAAYIHNGQPDCFDFEYQQFPGPLFLTTRT